MMSSYLLLLLFIMFPFGEIFRLQIGNNISITANDALVCITVVHFLFTKRSFTIPFKKQIIVFVLLCLLSLVANSFFVTPLQWVVAFLYLVRWVFYCLLFVVVYYAERKRLVINGMLFSGAMFACIGYVQYFFYNNLKNLYYLGWDDHMYRLFSSFFDPNFAGAFIVLYLVLLAGVFFSLGQRSNKKWIIAGLYLVVLPSLFLTFSRSALLMFIVSFSLLLLLLGRKKLIVGIVILLAFFIVVASKNFYIENMNLFRIASSEARLATAKEAFRIGSDHPIIGVGFNAYRYAQLEYGFREEKGAATSHADAGADNSFLFLFATTGILGLSSYLLLFYKVVRTLPLKQPFSLMYVVSLVGLVVNAQFINSLFYPFLMEWMWVLLGIAMKESFTANDLL